MPLTHPTQPQFLEYQQAGWATTATFRLPTLWVWAGRAWREGFPEARARDEHGWWVFIPGMGGWLHESRTRLRE